MTAGRYPSRLVAMTSLGMAFGKGTRKRLVNRGTKLGEGLPATGGSDPDIKSLQ
jgi:hypothetical protein